MQSFFVYNYSIEECNEKRKKMLNIPVPALKFIKCGENTSKHSNHIIATKLENIPICVSGEYAEGAESEIEISDQFVFFRLAEGVYLDCDQNAIINDILNYFALREGEFLCAVFKIEYGILDENAKFCSINSIGLSGTDNNVVLNICCQRKSFDLEKIICGFFPEK